jgi:c-di-GMP-binding flagellar brake protein YcgR
MENLTDFLIDAPKQVLIHLKTLAAEKCLIAVDFEDNFSFLTAILDIDVEKQLMTLDCGPKEYLNKKLLNTDIVNFKTELGGIKVLFEGRGIKKAGEAGQTALTIQIPQQIYWIQRREYYRMRSPLSKNSYCSITFHKTEENKETLDYQLYDLSASGFSILSETKKLAEPLTLDTEFNNCKLILNATTSYIISFIVRSKFALAPNRPLKIQRIGCQLLNTPPKIESAFIRYMLDIEREIKRNQK